MDSMIVLSFSLAEVADFWHGLLLYEEYLQSSRSQKEFQR